MRAGRNADQSVVMTTGALARTDGHDRAVVGGICYMSVFPIAGMAGNAIATARYTRLQ